MYGIVHIRSVSVGLDSQIWCLFIYITGYLNVRKISETMDFRTFVGPLIVTKTDMVPRKRKLVTDFFPCGSFSTTLSQLVLCIERHQSTPQIYNAELVDDEDPRHGT